MQMMPYRYELGLVGGGELFYFLLELHPANLGFRSVKDTPCPPKGGTRSIFQTKYSKNDLQKGIR
jgi:hypothetical protein